MKFSNRCFVSQRYWKMKAIHNDMMELKEFQKVVLYPKDTEKWKQFTTFNATATTTPMLFCIPKILKNESNSQPDQMPSFPISCCFVSQRYWKMKAIHNRVKREPLQYQVVLYPKDTEKWKQFTTNWWFTCSIRLLFCIPKILKNESNSQPMTNNTIHYSRCFVSQRYWKMKAIHNRNALITIC